MSVKKLGTAIHNLAVFMDNNTQSFWAKKLLDVKDNLQDLSKLNEARIELASFFGGMGSLNDVSFGENKLDAEFGKLSDGVFKENLLIDSGMLARLKWRVYEFVHADKLPPRIRNGFAP